MWKNKLKALKKLNIAILSGMLVFSGVTMAGCGASKASESPNKVSKESQTEISIESDKGTSEDSIQFADGIYEPSFAFFGGSGKTTISCSELEIKGGEYIAKISFSSSKYTWVKVDDVQYDNENAGGDSTFTIPVSLDGMTKITAETTAMSTPHEIEYELYIYLNGDASKELIKVHPEAADKTESDSKQDSNNTKESAALKAPQIDGLELIDEVKNVYAECFKIYHYSDGYTLIMVDDGRSYMLVPQNDKDISLPSDMIVLHKPLDTLYLAATAQMALFDALDAIDNIKMSSLGADGWYVDNARAAMNEGKLVFAGKYSAPDYEMLIDKKCSAAIESTMILHSPEVMEKIEELGIPVFVDRASSEKHPLGRTEWIRVYGEYVDKTDKADAFFKSQEAVVDNLANIGEAAKTVAFFYVNTNGVVVVRKSNDYMAKMIELAGGRYVFDSLGDDSQSSTVDMTMEEFFATAKDADYIIYNASIAGELGSVKDLIGKSELFSQFKAVKEGNVWCTSRSIYQATDSIGTIINEINGIINGDADDANTFIYHLD